MSDYRIRITVRNALLLRAIEQAGHRPGAQFAEAVGISYPIPRRVGGETSEIHWDALLLPRLDKTVGQPRGFRPNGRGWWYRDRDGKFADTVALKYLFTDTRRRQTQRAAGTQHPGPRIGSCGVRCAGLDHGWQQRARLVRRL